VVNLYDSAPGRLCPEVTVGQDCGLSAYGVNRTR